jgi:two-component system cell cycle sensor histidine kinase/response regulator CckA
LLDVMMPGMTGPELRDCLRDHLPSVRILFMSGYSYDQLVRQGIDSDKVEFVAKPFTISRLLGRVEEMLAETQRRHRSA